MTKVKELNATEKKEVRVELWEGGYYWIIDVKTGENIDGDKRKYIVKDMCKRWGFKIVK
jgi:hypothetical protein